MFKSKSVDSILKAFTTAISDLEKLETDNSNKSIAIADQQAALSIQLHDLTTESDRARSVRVRLQDLTSI